MAETTTALPDLILAELRQAAAAPPGWFLTATTAAAILDALGEPHGCGVSVHLDGAGPFPCIVADDGSAGSHDGDCVTLPELTGTWPPTPPPADAHRPETVTVLPSPCAIEDCDHSGQPGDECEWEQVQACTACSFHGVDLDKTDAVPITLWPCPHAPQSTSEEADRG